MKLGDPHEKRSKYAKVKNASRWYQGVVVDMQLSFFPPFVDQYRMKILKLPALYDLDFKR